MWANYMTERFDYFLTLPDEQLIIAERRHVMVIFSEIVTVLFLGTAMSAVSSVIFLFYVHSPPVFIAVLMVILCGCISLAVKTIIDWYLHLYIVTNKKILEIYYSPLFFYKITGVQLNQVRCTEIDEKKRGILNEILDVGDVVLTFDRPTHQEEFLIRDVRNPRQIALTLSNMFANLEPDNNTQPIWYKLPKKINIFPNTGQIFGKFSVEGG